MWYITITIILLIFYKGNRIKLAVHGPLQCFVHEIGHYIPALILMQNARLVWAEGKDGSFSRVEHRGKDKKIISYSGPVFGIISSVIMPFVVDEHLFFILITHGTSQIVSCIPEIIRIYKR